MKEQNNVVTLYGKVISNPVFHHKISGKRFFEFFLSVDRLNNNRDIIPILVNNDQMDSKKNYIGKAILMIGQFRSYNDCSSIRHRLKLHVFAHEITLLNKYDETLAQNTIFLDGYLCKEPIYRTTPFGKKITDIMLAINRPCGRTDYIPCITWNKMARYTRTLKVGSHVQLDGRIQSREYQKQLNETTYITKTAYEVSAYKIVSL